MNKDQIKYDLSLAIKHLGMDHVRSQEYSGRGMMGSSCTAIVISNLSEFVHVILAIKEELDEEYDGGQYEPYLVNVRMDNMGYDIVCYWESLPWISDDEEYQAA